MRHAMKRILVCAALSFSYLLISARGEAQVEVQILDAPAGIFSFEPVFVTFEVRNDGSSPVIIPTGSCVTEGESLESGRAGEELEDPGQFSDCGPEGLVWLRPGGRWLFFRRLWLGAEGEFEIEAVLRSPGECGGRPIGADKDHIAPLRPIVWGSRPYDCWSGTARSQRIEVIVEIPNSEADLAAAEYLKLGHVRWRNNWRAALMLSARDLYQRFPTSHYTYAAFGAFSSGTSMLNVVIRQPDNPLNPWVSGALARYLAYRNRPCAPPEPSGPGTPAELDERRERVIAAYPPPEPVQAYLRQLQTELAADGCPERAPEGDSASELEGSESTSSIEPTIGKDG
jgi:hypothetical protein